MEVGRLGQEFRTQGYCRLSGTGEDAGSWLSRKGE